MAQAPMPAAALARADERLAGPSDRIAVAIAAVLRRRQARRDYRRLLRAEAYVLDDIGVTRAEVTAALRALERGL